MKDDSAYRAQILVIISLAISAYFLFFSPPTPKANALEKAGAYIQRQQSGGGRNDL